MVSATTVHVAIDLVIEVIFLLIGWIWPLTSETHYSPNKSVTFWTDVTGNKRQTLHTRGLHFIDALCYGVVWFVIGEILLHFHTCACVEMVMMKVDCRETSITLHFHRKSGVWYFPFVFSSSFLMNGKRFCLHVNASISTNHQILGHEAWDITCTSHVVRHSSIWQTQYCLWYPY